MNPDKPLNVAFFKTEQGREPVREWLKELSRDDRKMIGEDSKAAQYGWPLGFPLVRKLEAGLWEIRTEFDRKIARVTFTIYENQIVLLHGFIKKSQKTPQNDLDISKKRLHLVRGGYKA